MNENNENVVDSDFEGYDLVGRDIDGWGHLAHLHETEQTVVGTIVEERLHWKDDPSRGRVQVPVLLIELTRALTTLDKRGDEIGLVPGQILAFSVNYSMKNLQGHVTDAVAIRPLEKIKLGAGKTVWKLKMGVRSSGKARPAALVPMQDRPEPVGDAYVPGDEPF
jgi:hypothetical protein